MSAHFDTKTLTIKTFLTMESAHPFVKNQQSRGKDIGIYGSGQYNASRDGGKRKHKGLDIIAKSGQEVYAPFPCRIKRKGLAYKNDSHFKLLELEGLGQWSAYLVRVLYVKPMPMCQSEFAAGDIIGSAQDLWRRYPGIINHIHVEVYELGVEINPSEIFNQSF